MAILCDDVMATGEDAFSNGATGGNQSISASSLDGLVGYADSDEEPEEDDEDHGALGDITVRALCFLSADMF